MSGGVTMALQTTLSLVVVVAIIFAASRLLGRASGQGGSGVLDVLARQGLGRSASVAIVRVADRAYVLGVTESQITLLGDADLAAITGVTQKAGTKNPPAGTAALHGSVFSAGVFSPAAWHQGIEAVRDRTARR